MESITLDRGINLRRQIQQLNKIIESGGVDNAIEEIHVGAFDIIFQAELKRCHDILRNKAAALFEEKQKEFNDL